MNNFYRLRQLRWLLGCGAVAVAEFFAGASLGQAQQFSPHFDVSAQAGDDVGLDNGYGRFGTFLPWVETADGLLVFSDTQVLVFHQDSEVLSANLGGGARYYDVTMDRIFGAYAYYDYRDRELAQYSQVGFGAETLGRVFDARVNVNLPTDTQNNFLATDIFANPVFGGPAGQNIVVGADRFQQALRVVDAEAGALLLDQGILQVRGYAGAYGLFGDDADDEWGVRARVEARVAEQVWASGYVQDDDVFGTTAGVSVVWRYGCGREKYDCGCLARRLYDPVQRRNHVAVRDTSIDILATDAGVPITVLHVDSSAAPGGSGGVNDPLSLLADASNQPQDIVFVHGGSVFNGEQVVISTEGQRFLAEGVPHAFASDQGNFLLPGVNPALATPQIVGSPATAVTVTANDAEVSGFTITGAGAHGISAELFAGINTNINRNNVTQSALTGIRVVGLNNSGSIANNTSSNNGVGIGISGAFTGDITGNTANDNTDAGIGVLLAPTVTGNITGNTANGNGTVGILVNSLDTTGNISQNVTNGNDDFGIVVTGPLTGNIADNTANNNADGGIAVTGLITGDVEGNTTNNNQGAFAGILIDNSIIGNIFGNTALGNAGGIHVVDNVTGNIANNVTNANRNAGIFVEGNVTGDITENEANDNIADVEPGDGIRVIGDVTGDVSDNVASNNAGSGIRLQGNVNGNIELNNTQENDFDGIQVVQSVFGNIFNNVASNNTNNGIRVLDNVNGFIQANTMNDNGNGLFVGDDVNGAVISNFAIGNTNEGFHIGGNLNGLLGGNEAIDNGQNGYRIDGAVAPLAPDVVGFVLGNLAQGNGESGFLFNGQLQSVLVDNNRALENGASGMVFTQTVTGVVSSNIASDNDQSGIVFTGNVFGNVEDNITTDNLFTGIAILQGIVGDIAGNLAEDNGTEGIGVTGLVNGDVRDNITNRNAENMQFLVGVDGSILNNIANDSTAGPGIFVDGNVLGDVMDNFTSFNLTDGIHIQGSVVGDVTDNTANDNGDDGIDVDGGIGGNDSPNSFSNNGDQGLEN